MRETTGLLLSTITRYTPSNLRRQINSIALLPRALGSGPSPTAKIMMIIFVSLTTYDISIQVGISCSKP
jgi:hypothetical protein